MFDRNTPSHMTLITGYDNSGKPLVSYERGYIDGYPVSEEVFNSKPIGYFTSKEKAPDYDSYRKFILQKQRDSYRKNEPLWEGENFTGYETYRFVGTPDDNARWEQEYAALPAYDLIPPVHNNLENLRDGYRLSYADGGLLKDYRSGGKIHIKPENRGKFTALKKRTGHSASWFKAHGTPAQKKMAVFELNSRKWSHRHADGGHLLGNIYDLTEEQINELIRQGYEVERV